MPNVQTAVRRLLLATLLLGALPVRAAAQRPDTAAVRDSVARDSLARADSVRADSVRRGELARIRAEPRAPEHGGDLPGSASGEITLAGDGRPRPGVSIAGASVAADMIGDLSPKAAARNDGSRIRLRDIEASVEAQYGPRLSGLLTLIVPDGGSATQVVAIDAAAVVRLPISTAQTDLIVGRTSFPFGRSAQLHRHAMVLPDQPLPVRVLLGPDRFGGTGVQIRAARGVGAARLTLDVAVADRFGARVDSLHPGEPPDQSLGGLAAGGRLGAQLGIAGTHLNVGVSSVSAKREQPIGCVYDGTVGPVPCPEGVNAANTRLTVLGADARLVAGANNAFSLSGEWLRMVVGATDLPVFSNVRFAPFYRGLTGTYSGGYLDANVNVRHGLTVGTRGEWLQNPEVMGLNDAWAGGYVGMQFFDAARITASYQRRIPSRSALAAMPVTDRDARDRVVLRGTIVIGHHPLAGLD